MTRTGLVVAAVLLVGGCGQDAADDGRLPYEPAAVEEFLRNEVVRTTAKDIPVGAVRCPDTLVADVGAVATCGVELDGVATTYLVQVLAGRRFEARPQHPIVDLHVIEEQIVNKAGEGTSAACGPIRIVQLTPTQQVTCGITGVGLPRRAVVSADPDGTVRVTDA